MDDSGPCSSLSPREFRTLEGCIRYWVTPHIPDAPDLVFLPGLSADRRLFDQQIAHFSNKANCLVWDAPSHGKSRPFSLSWTLEDKARWLHELLAEEGIAYPVLIGQSMGGFLAQVYIDMFPGEVSGFVSIDSAPLKREFYSSRDLSALRHTRAMYVSVPWKLLLKLAASGCAATSHGQKQMREMMEEYGKRDCIDLVAHGFEMIAKAVEDDRRYKISCPAVIICGKRDGAGAVKALCRQWSRKTNIPLQWIEGAGHNANVDAPDKVNAVIDEFLVELDAQRSMVCR